MQKIIVVGGGGHAKMCLDIIKAIGDMDVIGIIDNNIPIGTKILGIPIIGTDEYLHSAFKIGITKAINGVGGGGNQLIRRKIYEKLKSIGFELPNLIHPKAIVEESATIPKSSGIQIMAGAIVGSSAYIGNGCIINSGAIVSHDCVISDHVHITPGAILAGNVQVGENSIIGMGSTVYFGTKIGKGCVVANGSNLFKNIVDGTVLKVKI